MCVVVLSACSKKKEATSEETAKTPADSARATTASNAPLTPANAPYASVIASKGYRVVQARRFPAQVDARRAAVVVYQSGDNARGGILYVRGYQTDPMKPVWHWYFADAAPDSVAPVDVNQDGLWDVRVYMAGGKTTELIQDKDFTFVGGERAGLVAMNGASSQADGLWQAFDADTATVWKAPAPSYVDIPNPFGLAEGQLAVRLAPGSSAARIAIGDGTSTLEDYELAATADEQRFKLDDAVKSLPTIRVTVTSEGKSVALSELEIR
jgi:hypothetical protein